MEINSGLPCSITCQLPTCTYYQYLIINIVVYYELQGFPEQGLKCPDLAEEYHGPAAHYQPSLGQKKVNTVGVVKKAHCQARLKSDVVGLNV